MRLRIATIVVIVVLIATSLFVCTDAFVQPDTLLSSYKSHFENKIYSSISKSVLITSDSRQVTQEKIKQKTDWLHKQLARQLKVFDSVFLAYKVRTGFDFNKADTVTILIQGQNPTGAENYVIWSGNDTIKSAAIMGIARLANNGGNRLEALHHDATNYSIYKTANNNLNEPFLEMAFSSDTAQAYESDLYCPFEGLSVILTAKRFEKGYKISDYYLHQFRFVEVPMK